MSMIPSKPKPCAASGWLSGPRRTSRPLGRASAPYTSSQDIRVAPATEVRGHQEEGGLVLTERDVKRCTNERIREREQRGVERMSTSMKLKAEKYRPMEIG